MKKGTAIFPGWLFPFVYCVAGVDAYLGAIRYGKFGDALCVVGEARKMNEIASQLLKKEPNLFLSVKAIPGDWY